ncbi:MAG: hypothetical protein IM638_03830 [Bacteroidetes bacterium]|nr:hypothetical protein [Bacteroidota bacterium]
MNYIAALSLLLLLAACGSNTPKPVAGTVTTPAAVADTLNRFDTITANGHTIMLLPATEAQFNVRDASEWRIPCNENLGEQHFSCLEKWMKDVLIADSAIVSRTDSVTMRIRLNNGNNIFLRDTLYTEANEGDVRLNEYMGRLYRMPWLVFGRTYYEAFDAALYNLNTGQEVPLYHYPILSPQKNWLLVYNYDLEAGYTFNGLQLLSLSGDNATVVFERAYDKWGATNAKWISANEAIIEQSVPDYGSPDYRLKKFYARLVIN